MYFVHKRSIPKKGNILYYYGIFLATEVLVEISVAFNGKGIIVVKAQDPFKGRLTMYACKTFVERP